MSVVCDEIVQSVNKNWELGGAEIPANICAYFRIIFSAKELCLLAKYYYLYDQY